MRRRPASGDEWWRPMLPRGVGRRGQRTRGRRHRHRHPDRHREEVGDRRAEAIVARIGLINTMVFTHLPSNILLILIPFAPNLAIAIALLLARSALSQMDVPTRTSYVMAVVIPPERPAAASITAVPKTFAWAAGSLISDIC
jgi:hypothetical protein